MVPFQKAVFLYSVIARSRGGMYLPAVLHDFSGFGAESVYRYSCYYWMPISLVLLIFSLQKGFLSRILSNKYLVIGGDISYSFYLIHLWILFAYVQLAQTYDWHISLYISIPLIFAVTIGLSLLSYYYFEKPANRWVKRILNKQ